MPVVRQRLTRSNDDGPPPSLHGHYTRFNATTRQSVPLRRIGTFGLAVGAACAFSLGIAGQVLTFRTRARLSFAPPTCRMPLGQSQCIPQALPGRWVSPRFWHRLIAFRHFCSGSLALASLNHACRNLVPTFPQRSPPSLLTTAACGGLRSAPDCRPRRTSLHLSYSCASPFGRAILVTQDANKQRSIPGSEWQKTRDPETASRAVKEYLATLDDAAFGAASEVTPKFVSPSDPAAQWTGAMRGPAFFAYADNYLVDVKFGVIVDVE